MEKCPDCGKEFETVEALGQHAKMKHHIEKKPKIPLNRKTRNYIIAVVIIIAVASITYAVATAPGKYDDFAKCLTSEGAKFYGAFWCPHCAEQKQILGGSMKYIDYVECSTPDGKNQLDVCKQLGINSYPTWIFSDGSHVESIMQPSGLALKTQCKVPA